MISSAVIGGIVGGNSAIGTGIITNANIGNNITSSNSLGGAISSNGIVYSGGNSGGNGFNDMTKVMFTSIAGTNLGGQRVVMIIGSEAFYYDATNEASIGATIGMTNGAASVGASVDVILEGIVNNPGWGLVPGDVYFIGINGLINNTPPTSGVSFRVGVAIDADNLLLKLSEEIFLI
jgi:hypothetical protein